MANAIQAALDRASPEQKGRNEQVLEEARRNLKLVSMQSLEDAPLSASEKAARNVQYIEEARRTIPADTMKSVDEIGPPLHTPSRYRVAPNSKVISLDPEVRENIEKIQESRGNNYLAENAVDRAQERASHSYYQEPQQERER